MDVLWLVLLILVVAGLSMLVGSSRGRDDLRMRRRGESMFEAETRRQVHTDATGMLMCRSCGAAASERAGRCPSCGAGL